MSPIITRSSAAPTSGGPPSACRHGRLLSRRKIILGAGGFMASTVVPAADSALPVPGSLKQAADLARKAGEPLVILVSLPGCPYCELVRRNYLLPMRNEGVHAYQIDVTDSRKVVRGFDEVATTGAQLAERWNATFTPTVLFFDSRGQEIAGRLKGVASPDFYGSYLDDALAQARKTFAGRS